jgi:hypothetical protein
MALNFNLGKMSSFTNKNKDSEEIVTETTETTTTTTNSKKTSSYFRKTMLKLFVGMIIFIVVILLILLIASLFSKPDYTYSSLEAILKEAGIKYGNNNKENLPTSESENVEIDSATLIAGKYMKAFSEYNEKYSSCTGTVIVAKVGNDYTYTPYLDCGDSYSTKELTKELTQDSNIVTSGAGLYNENGTYVYRGETVNNYVKLDGGLWRIIKVNADNTITIIKADPIKNTLVVWDDRYNTERNSQTGINDYSASRLKDSVNTWYKYSDLTNTDTPAILSKADKDKLVKFNLCIGKRDINNTTKDNSVECATTIANTKMGLLTVADYLNASLDTNCSSSLSPACQNYNYLMIKDTAWWLVTASSANTREVYRVDGTGVVVVTIASSMSRIRPVVILNSSVLYSGGKGTTTNPYIIK